MNSSRMLSLNRSAYGLSKFKNASNISSGSKIASFSTVFSSPSRLNFIEKTNNKYKYNVDIVVSNRKFSTASNQTNTEGGKTDEKQNFDEQDDYEGSTEVSSTPLYVLLFWGLLGTVAIACVGVVVVELNPIPRMNTSNLMAETMTHVYKNDEVRILIGEIKRAYGRETGNDGRRNDIDNRTFTESDGSKRFRVRYNVEGKKGHLVVYAEVRDYYKY